MLTNNNRTLLGGATSNTPLAFLKPTSLLERLNGADRSFRCAFSASIIRRCNFALVITDQSVVASQISNTRDKGTVIDRRRFQKDYV